MAGGELVLRGVKAIAEQAKNAPVDPATKAVLLGGLAVVGSVCFGGLMITRKLTGSKLKATFRDYTFEMDSES
jgi:hypothetical protein